MSFHKRIHEHIQEKHEWVKGKFTEIARNETTPHEVGLGFAIGIFVAMATPGFDALVALLVVLLFKVNKLAVFIGVALINPITTAFIYPFSFKLGTLIVGYKPLEHTSFFSIQNLLNMSKPLLVGNVAMAFVLGIIAYFLAYWIYYYSHYRFIKKKLLSFQEKGS